MDRLQVINRALLKAGLPVSAILKDTDWNANLVYEDVATEILRGHPWGFAQKYATLAASVAGPEFGWDYAYSLPEDCMRVIDVHCQNDLRSPKCRYILAGEALYSNASPCHLRYVRRELDPDRWPPDFLDAVACRIAMEIIGLSGNNMGLVPQLTQLYNISLNTAQLIDAREGTERVPLPESLYASRGSREG